MSAARESRLWFATAFDGAGAANDGTAISAASARRTIVRFMNNLLSAQSDDEDQRGESADSDPDPLLLREARGLDLVEILRQLMQILRRKLGDLLVNLLLVQA